MTPEAVASPALTSGGARPRFQIDKRYLAPILVTMVLVVGQITFGFLESWGRTMLAIATAIAIELVLGKLFTGKMAAPGQRLHLGDLDRHARPVAGDLAVRVVLGDLDLVQYLIRVDGRHIWNPSNLGIVAMLVLAADTVASLSVQWGNTLLPMVTVWLFGAVIINALGRFHITLTYVVSFIVFAAVRAAVTGPSVPRRGGADHRADVPALHLLHDHGPEDDRAHQAGPDAHRRRRGGG